MVYESPIFLTISEDVVQNELSPRLGNRRTNRENIIEELGSINNPSVELKTKKNNLTVK